MTTETTPLVFKVATEDWEFEQIHRLNYRTFVEEIPQHQASPTHRLVDKFHAENTYLICLCDHKIVGMLAARGNRPFSLDQKVAELDTHLPSGHTICEIRLLAIDKKYRGARGGQILSGILALLWQHGVEKGYGLAVISGTIRQLKLYQHLGFVPFGPLVGTGEAQFQPMFVTLETFEMTAREFLRNAPAKSFQPSAVNFLPGPVTVRREVRRAFEQSPESHRSDSFMADFNVTRKLLCELTNAAHVQLMMGSGTLANDAIAAQLSQVAGNGLVLSNGEFGNRLIDAARRSGLRFEALSFPSGEGIDLVLLRQRLDRLSAPSWLWCVHCETSTGIVNDIQLLAQICRERGAKLCIDAISTIGTMDLDLSGVYLSSGSSGKGLRSYPGIAMVFHNHEIKPNAAGIPRYIDLGYYATQDGIPFTFSSNLLHALQAAVSRVNWQKRFTDTVEISGWLRMKLAELGFRLVGAATLNSPAVITIELPSNVNSVEFGKLMQESGFLLSCNSKYLQKRNWIQVCLMGEIPREKATTLVNALKRVWQREAKKAGTEKTCEDILQDS